MSISCMTFCISDGQGEKVCLNFHLLIVIDITFQAILDQFMGAIEITGFYSECKVGTGTF